MTRLLIVVSFAASLAACASTGAVYTPKPFPMPGGGGPVAIPAPAPEAPAPSPEGPVTPRDAVPGPADGYALSSTALSLRGAPYRMGGVDPASGRIVATRRLNKYLNQTPPAYKEGQEVELMLYGKTELGYKAIVEGKHSGVLFGNEVFRRLRAGEKTKGYVVQARPDGKIDLSLYPPGRARIDDLETRIEDELKRRGGFWALSDSSPAEEIHRALGVSKKAFKQATGALFKKRKITLGDEGMRLVE